MSDNSKRQVVAAISEGAPAIGACAWPSESQHGSGIAAAATGDEDARGPHRRFVRGVMHLATQFVIFLMR